MNMRIFPVIPVVAALLLIPLESNAQSVDAKLAVLEKLLAAERQQKSGTSGKAGGLNCEPLKAVWPATPACLLLEHL